MNFSFQNSQDLLKKLVKFDSTSPDIKCVEYYAKVLLYLGFEIDLQIFNDTANLYATIGNKNGENFCFSGHLDVVPIIDRDVWLYDPFEIKIIDDKIFGRGTVDMKGGIAAFTQAIKKILASGKNINNKQISLLITGDEEASGQNGTKKMLEYLHKKNVKLDHILIGEIASENDVVDSVIIGRGGSLNFEIKVQGIGGHVAQAKSLDNPITRIVNICNALKQMSFSNSEGIWPASNLEITMIDAQNNVENIIISEAKIRGNIRFNFKDNRENLIEKIKKLVLTFVDKKNVEFKFYGLHNGYSNPMTNFAKMALKKCQEINKNAKFSVGYGVTDGSFISKYCTDIIEIGPKFEMAHKINEYIEIKDLNAIELCYSKIIEEFIK